MSGGEDALQTIQKCGILVPDAKKSVPNKPVVHVVPVPDLPGPREQI